MKDNPGSTAVAVGTGAGEHLCAIHLLFQVLDGRNGAYFSYRTPTNRTPANVVEKTLGCFGPMTYHSGTP